MIREKQASQVIEAMRKEGGYATLRRLKYFILVKYELQLYSYH